MLPTIIIFKTILVSLLGNAVAVAGDIDQRKLQLVAPFCVNDKAFASVDRGCTEEKPFCAGPDGEDIPVDGAGLACFVCEHKRSRMTNARGCPEEAPICGTNLGTVAKSHHDECYVCVNDDDGVADIGCDAEFGTPYCRAADGSALGVGEGGMGCFAVDGAVPPSAAPSFAASEAPSEVQSAVPSSMMSDAVSLSPSSLPSTSISIILDVDFEPPARRSLFKFVSDMFHDGDDEYTKGFYHLNKGKPDLPASNPSAGLVTWLGGVDFSRRFDMSAGWRRFFTLGTPMRSVKVQYDYQVIWAYKYDEGDESRLFCGIDGNLPYEIAYFNDTSPRGRGNWTTAMVDVGDLDAGRHYLDLGGTNYRKDHKFEKTYLFMDNVLVTGEVLLEKLVD